MRTTILKIIGATLITSLTVQMAAATEHHARRARAPAVERFRNSNAYAAPGNIAGPAAGWSDEAEAAMTSGVAGH
jgi:hypothetical protein